MRRLVVIVLALAVGVGAGVGSAAGAASRHGVVAAKKAKHCGGKRVRRCRPTYRMSAKRLHPIASAAKLAAPVAGVPAAPPGTPTTTTPVTTAPPPPPPGPVVSTVGANAFDMGGFVLRLTRTSVQAGNLTVFFMNHDVSDHNLWIEGPDGLPTQISDAIGENASTNKTVPVTPGTWRLFCSLPGHEAMTRDLLVTP